MMRTNLLRLIILLIIGSFAYSCNNVEDGIDEVTDVSNADFSVQLLSEDRGAVDDTISYAVTVNATSEIQALYIQEKNGTELISASASGFDVDDSDPFVDHVYGTVQSGTTTISLTYNYVVSQDSVDMDLIFTLVDETGIARDTQEVVTVPSMTEYEDVILYAQDDKYVDGFSTNDGTVYHYLSNYEDYTDDNIAIQESVDLVFIVDNDSLAVMAAPYDGYFDSGFSEKNKTHFVLLEDMDAGDFDAVTNATLSSITEDNEVKSGDTYISDVWVGDVIAFRTDYSSTNSYHYGILRVTAMHPTEVSYYDGTCYLMEVDVKVQVDSE